MRIMRGGVLLEIPDSDLEAQAFEQDRAALRNEIEASRVAAEAERNTAVAALEAATGLTIEQIKTALR